MNAKANEQYATFNLVLWVVGLGLAAAGVAADYIFAEQVLAIRIIGWLVLAAIVSSILIRTQQGQSFVGFAKEARIEMRKVVWPNRQEIMQTTFIVVVMVIVTAILVWGIDVTIMWIVRLLTGQVGL